HHHLGGECVTQAGYDVRLDRAASPWIGYTHDGRLRHGVELDDDVFHFAREDAEPRHADQLLHPVYKNEITVGVEVSDVARGEPAFLSRGTVAVRPVAGEQVVATH